MRVACMLIVFACVSASPAWAQENTAEAVAEELFAQGRELLKQGHIDEACVRFESSHKLDPALGTLLNLALCREEQGKVATAWILYRDAALQAALEGEARREAVARERARALEADLPRLIIEVAEASQIPGLVIERNGVTMGAALLWQAVYVDPGAHQIVARAPGYAEWSVEKRIEKGERAMVTIPGLKALVREVSVREGSVPEGSVRDASVPEASVREASVPEASAAIPVLQPEETKASAAIPVLQPEETKASAAIPIVSTAMRVDEKSGNSIHENLDISDANSGQGGSLSLGATGGAAGVTYGSEGIVSESFRTAFKAGLFMSLAPHERFAARLEILYMAKGTDIETWDGGYWSTLNATYLGGVLLGELNLTRGSIRPYVLAGAEWRYMLEASTTGNAILMTHDTTGIDFGVIAGAGVGWRVSPRHEIMFETRIDFGLRNTVFAESSDYKLLNRSLMFMLGYRFFVLRGGNRK
jgi:hypothetical protein